MLNDTANIDVSSHRNSGLCCVSTPAVFYAQSTADMPDQCYSFHIWNSILNYVLNLAILHVLVTALVM
jgi:hypothetical protein